jgi:hypothetical protein
MGEGARIAQESGLKLRDEMAMGVGAMSKIKMTSKSTSKISG